MYLGNIRNHQYLLCDWFNADGLQFVDRHLADMKELHAYKLH